MKLRRILVPTDFSEHADEALTYAQSLAKRAGASLHLLHVCQVPPHLFVDVPESIAVEAMTGLITAARGQLGVLESRLREAGLSAESSVVEGVPHRAVDKYARAHDIDLIVQGTHGRSGVARVVLGSVTERVLRTVDVPIIAVPKGAGTREPATILVAYDLSEPAKKAARAARTIHGVVRGAMHLVHTYLDVWGEYTDRGSLVGDAAERRREALKHGLIEMLKRDADSLFSIDAQAVQIHLLTGDPAEQVLRLAKEIGADLICAGKTGKTGLERLLLGSVALRLLHKSTIPLLFAH